MDLHPRQTYATMIVTDTLKRDLEHAVAAGRHIVPRLEMIGGSEEDQFRKIGTDIMAILSQKDLHHMALKGRKAGRL
jgi:hypothetical protein